MKKSLIALALWLTGCSSAVTLNYYQLPQSPEQALSVSTSNSATAQSQQPVVIVEPVMVANYLNTNSLILQTSDVELHRTTQHLWLDALDQQLNRLLVNALQNQLPNKLVTSQALPVAADSSQRLLVQVDEFHGTAQGKVVLRGRYSVLSGPQVKLYPFQIERLQAEEGYPAMVSTMGLAVADLTRQIAAALQ